MLALMGWRVLEEIPMPAFATDLDGRVMHANRAAASRWPEATAVADGFPEDVRARFAAAHERATVGAGDRFEWGEIGPGGVRSWFVSTVSPWRDGDNITGSLCVSADVSDLKRSEERLRLSERLMVDTQGVAHLGTWDWDISQPNATWSEELYRIYGLTPETYTPSYESYLTMVHPDDRQRVIDATNGVFHQHVPYSHDERIFRPDGSMRYLHTWARPILDDEGKLVRLVGVCQDITDRKLAEEELRLLNVELERRVEDRTRLLQQSMHDLEAFNAMVSHDLRAPLTVIQVCTGLIEKHLPAPVPTDLTDNISRIQQSVVHMSGMVDDLLALARVGQLPLQRGDVDLALVAKDVLAELARADPARHVEIDVASTIHCLADARLTRTMMQNLLGNAWKYTRRVAHPRIEVGTTTVDGRPVVYVRDNGAGFDPSEAHRLFAPFERLHDSADFPGTGVGLATVQRIVERHGGRVWAESAAGRGATFFVDICAA